MTVHDICLEVLTVPVLGQDIPSTLFINVAHLVYHLPDNERVCYVLTQDRGLWVEPKNYHNQGMG